MQQATRVNGYDIVREPALARLRRYLPVLGIIGAPFADLSGTSDPVNPLDDVGEWHALREAILAAEGRVPLALVRMRPPTASRLERALAVRGADAFRVVHIVAHGERDMLYLEDERGFEDYAVAEYLANLFRQSATQLLFLDGCYSRRVAELLTEETPLLAVLGTRRRVLPAQAAQFNTHFYRALSEGAPIEEAFHTARATLPEGRSGADRYELTTRRNADTLCLRLPEATAQAEHSLVWDGQPPTLDVPARAGFVGRREALSWLADALSREEGGVCALVGVGGVGKTALAAAAATRFAWRFDGVAWFAANARSTLRDVLAQLARLLSLAPHAEPEAILAATEKRHLLVVLDAVDTFARAKTRARLGGLVRKLAQGGAHVLLTAHSVEKLPLELPAEHVLTLERFSAKEARTLAMRLAVERGIEALDVDTIDDFLDRTLNLPWLIVRGIAWAQAWGLERALRALRVFDAETDDPRAQYFRRQAQALALEENGLAHLLRRAQSLPDGFDERLAQGLSGEEDDAALHEADLRGFLAHDGALYRLPPTLRAALRTHAPLPPQRRARVERAILRYLAQSWPSEPLGGHVRAWLNNARALLPRALAEDGNAESVAALLDAAAETFQAAGLVREFVEYARRCRELLPPGEALARLQVAMGTVMGAHAAYAKEAGFMFQMTLELPDLPADLLAETRLAYARYLLRDGQSAAAAHELAYAVKAQLAEPQQADVARIGALLHEWARALAELGQPVQAIKRYQEALAAYAKSKQPRPAARAMYELGALLAQNAAADRAREIWARALRSAQRVDDRPLVAQIHEALGALALAEGHAADAVRHFADALSERLTAPDAEALTLTQQRLAEAETSQEQTAPHESTL